MQIKIVWILVGVVIGSLGTWIVLPSEERFGTTVTVNGQNIMADEKKIPRGHVFMGKGRRFEMPDYRQRFEFTDLTVHLLDQVTEFQQGSGNVVVDYNRRAVSDGAGRGAWRHHMPPIEIHFLADDAAAVVIEKWVIQNSGFWCYRPKNDPKIAPTQYYTLKDVSGNASTQKVKKVRIYVQAHTATSCDYNFKWKIVS